MNNHGNNGLGTTFLAFTLGAVIGGGVALLMAPRSGSETREKLQEKIDGTRSKLNDMTQEAEDRIKKTVQDGMDKLEEKADLIKTAAKAGKEAMDAEKAKQAENTKKA